MNMKCSKGSYFVNSCLNFKLRTKALPVTKAIVSDVLQSHKLQVEESVVVEPSTALCKSNPLAIAISKDGPLGTVYKCAQHYTSHFGVIQPMEYISDAQRNRKFQYTPFHNLCNRC